MRYADRDGNIYEEENGQDRLLHWMYTTMAGRASLKILIRPWVSKLGGAFLSSPISKCLIKGFVKNNHIDMSEYEKKNYKSYNEFFSRKIKEGKRPFPEDKSANLLRPGADFTLSHWLRSSQATASVRRTHSGQYRAAFADRESIPLGR